MTRLATAIARVQGIASTVVTGALLVIPLYAIRAQNANGTNPGTGSRIAITAPDSLSINFADTDLRLVVQALSPYLDHPLVFGNLPAARVSLQTPRPVAQSAVMQLLRGILDSQGLELILDPGANLYRVRSKEPPKPIVEPSAIPPAAVGTKTEPELFVIHLEHARSADVAATVNALYGRSTALGESQLNGASGKTLPQALQQNVLPPSAQTTGTSASVPSEKAALFSGETVIIPDEKTNALLIRANEHDFQLIKAAVTELDVRPLQVLIEVLIAEVNRNASFALGIGGNLPLTDVRAKHVDGVTVGGVIGNGPVSDSTLGDFVLHVLKRGSGVNVTATITAAQARGEARILSRPVLIAANGQSAEILVGSQRPFVQVQRSFATATSTRDQVIEYKDVGTRLSVKPTISIDGYVMLSVTQEVNQATAELQFDAPVISTRTVQTQVLVHDGQTVVLGGLSDREHDVSRSGVPLLSRIPVLGALFGTTQRQTNETEFFLFITPRVIRTDEDADEISNPLWKRSGARVP